MRLPAAVLTSVFLLFPALATSSVVEVGGPNLILSPYDYWANPRDGRFYNPSGIRFGDEFLLFVQGGPYVNVTSGPGHQCDPGEQALVFSAPWTWQGVRNKVSFLGVASPCHPAGTGVHYQTGSVLVSEWDGRLKLFIDESVNGAEFDEGDFKRTLIASSADGRSWSHETFLQQSTVYDPALGRNRTLSIIEVILVQEPGGGDWWGVFTWGETAPGLTGKIKVVRDVTNPRGYVVYLKNASNVWQAVANDGTFNFVPLQLWGNFTKANDIHFDGTTYTVWSHATDNSAVSGCNDGTPTTGSTFQYRTISKDGPLGAIQQVTSQVRAMPSINNTARKFPDRLKSGSQELLYSTSTDRICNDGLMTPPTYHGAEILLTVIQ